MTRTTLLALDLGIREVGYAVFAEHELADQGVKSLRRSQAFLDRAVISARVLSVLLRERQPHVVALIQTTSLDQRVNNCLRHARAIALSLAHRRGLPVYAFPPAVVDFTVTHNCNATKRALARAVVHQYPQLTSYLNRKVEWRERYNFRLFDAVACGLTYLALRRTDQLNEYAV